MNSGFHHDLVGGSAATLALIGQTANAARNHSAVLILGETGTGKELVARAIHVNSPRAAGPFVAVNCAAIPELLFENELFGHEKGAFTGALNARQGEFERAACGTLFLDEVGELPQSGQTKLLRALQQREIKRLGAAQPIKTDVRIIAATNRNLRDGFRSDLFYRLNVITLRTPPLRERRDDIPILARHFISLYAPQSGREVSGISNEADILLQSYDWPGNVRELQNVIEQAVMMGSSEMILPEDLPDFADGAPIDFEAGVAAAKRSLIEKAFILARGEHDKACALLQLNQNYVYSLLKKLNLTHLRRSTAGGQI